MNKEIVKEEWYENLIEECKAIVTEAIFTSRWALVEGYWKLGERISGENNNFKREKIYGEKIVQGLAESLGISSRTIHYAIQAYNKFPDLGKIPEGKNISWNKLVTLYLPEPKVKTPELPEGKYQVILADPPWLYGQEQHSKEKQDTVLETHYPSLATEKICELPIKELGLDNSVLFLWTTSPKLFESKSVIDAWGYEYKASMIWDKVKHNVGYYVSVRHEFLLICTKGSCLPDNPKLHDSVITEERTEHSRKPEVFYDIIEDIYKGKKIELFARKPRKNWDSWGNQI